MVFLKKRKRNDKNVSGNKIDIDIRNKKQIKKDQIKALKAARRARKKTNVQRKPFARSMSLFLAILMLGAFVFPTGLIVWNVFFAPKSSVPELGGGNRLQQLLEQLESLKQNMPNENDVADEESGENEPEPGETESSEEPTKSNAPESNQQENETSNGAAGANKTNEANNEQPE